MRLLHILARTHASFDDPNLVSRAGLVPVMAQRAGLGGLIAEHVRPGGENAHLKIPCLVAGMAAGADSIDDMDLLRHGVMPGLFGRLRTPSMLGSHLRSFTWGNVRQLEMVNCLLLGELLRCCPAGRRWHSSIWTRCRNGSTVIRSRVLRSVHIKIQGKSLLVRGLNSLAAPICTPPGRAGDRGYPACIVITSQLALPA